MRCFFLKKKQEGLKRRSSARLSYFGAPRHPKHVFGGSPSLSPGAAPSPLAAATDPPRGPRGSSACGPEAASLCKIKCQHSYFPLNAGTAGRVDPLPPRSEDLEGPSCCFLCSFATSTLLNNHRGEDAAPARARATHAVCPPAPAAGDKDRIGILST